VLLWLVSRAKVTRDGRSGCTIVAQQAPNKAFCAKMGRSPDHGSFLPNTGCETGNFAKPLQPHWPKNALFAEVPLAQAGTKPLGTTIRNI
jgi:hypothetical protein